MAKDNSALMIALGGLKKPKGKEEPEGDDEMDMEADDADVPDSAELKATAVADIRAAFDSGDDDALSDALTRFVQACSEGDY